jgi:plasmid maintenance system antidote protein VapI
MFPANDITPDRIANHMTPFEPTHPGEVLQEELEERGILLEAALDIDADFWLNMQSAYDKYSDITTFENDARAALSEYQEFLKGNHKLKSEEEFWKEIYKD